MNGDGLADILGFGSAGAYVSLAIGGGQFGPTTFVPGFGASPAGGGWINNDLYPRLLGDVNGDGMADIVGFGSAGGYVALATGGGQFGPVSFLPGFGASPVGGGWYSNDVYPRALGDVNGDGMADIVGFGSAGTYVSLATSNGNFGPTFLALAGFGASPAGGGWSSQDLYSRAVADVNGDGMADIVDLARPACTSHSLVGMAASDQLSWHSLPMVRPQQQVVGLALTCIHANSPTSTAMAEQTLLDLDRPVSRLQLVRPTGLSVRLLPI